MATQDPKKRASFLVVKRVHQMADYHHNLIKGMNMMLAVMGFDHIDKLSKKNLTFKNRSGKIYFNIDEYFKKKFYL